MIALLLDAVAIVVAAAAIGHAVCALCGVHDAPAWAPAVGLALVLALARVAIEAPGHATTAAIVVALAAVASLAWRPGRAALAVRWADRVPTAVGVLALAALPLIVSGRAGILGVGQNNDMSAHLTGAWWLDTRFGVGPVASTDDPLLAQGYPLGPHAVAAALARGTGSSIVAAFDAVMLAIPVILALAALAVVGDRVARPLRWLGAAAVGLCYLVSAYSVQAAFKETLMGLLLVAFAVALQDVATAPVRARLRGVPLGVLAAGTLYTYSYPGLVWPAATVGIFLVVEAARRPRALLTAARAAVAPAAGAVLALLLVAAPEAGRIQTFAASSFAHEPLTGKGNLPGPLRASEALGIWLRDDFRYSAHPYRLDVALAAAAVVALVVGLAYLARRRQAAVAAALIGGAVVAWRTHDTRNIYNAAKTIVVVAPLVSLVMLAGLAGWWSRIRDASRVAAARAGRRGEAPRGGARRRLARIAVAALAAVVGAGAGVSTLLVLRDGFVGPTTHSAQLEELGASIQGRSVLYLGVDDFAQWELRGTRLTTGPLLYARAVAHPWLLKPWGAGGPFDVDNFSGGTLDAFTYLITPAGGYHSRPTPNFRKVRRTPDFVLWRRTGRTPQRFPAESGGASGRRLHCGTAHGRAILARGGFALVIPAPVTLEQREWNAQPVRVGDAVGQTIDVPAGTWRVSLEYVSNSGLSFQAGALRTTLPATLDRFGPFWPVGRIVKRRSGPVRLHIAARPTSAVGRLLRAPARTRALNSRNNAPLGRLALTRAGARSQLVPVAQACGRYVDWYAARR